MAKAISLIFIAIVLSVLMIYQATRASATLMQLPSELSAQGIDSHHQSASAQRVRVAGRVAAGTIRYETQPVLELSFSIVDPPSSEESSDLDSSRPPTHPPVPVKYRGVKPDMFADGRDVILEGSMVSGVLIADSLMTQCPSKYEAPDPNAMYESDAPQAAAESMKPSY